MSTASNSGKLVNDVRNQNAELGTDIFEVLDIQGAMQPYQ